LLSLITSNSTDDRIGITSNLVHSALDVSLDFRSSRFCFSFCVFTFARVGNIRGVYSVAEL